MDRMRCVVEHITYRNEENGYTVLKVRAKGFPELVSAVGNLAETHAGAVLTLEGNWKVDSRYGKQFIIEKYEETLPATAYGMEKYLGSGLIKGIGPKYAQRIVREFGDNTLTIIEESPEELIRVPGLGKARVNRIIKSWAEQKEIKNVMLFLQEHDVSTSHAAKIYRTYGSGSIQAVTENPYRLADDIWGIGFRTADTIAMKMGFGKERYARLRAGLLYALNRLADEGHCYATRDQLTGKGKELLEADEGLLSMTLDEMIRAKDVITEGTDMVYLPPFYFAETGTAARLQAVWRCSDGVRITPDEERIRFQTGMTYDETQMDAIIRAGREKVLVLTGGPGTGKTTTTLGIITALRDAGAEILLAAPTGRAAKRLSEATGMEAKTIHRLLEFKPQEGYGRNPENPLQGDVLIVDECSMIDILLMYNLMKAVPDRMKVILIGDVDQLPSVGAGNVLRDIISSGQFPTVRLTRIFRQAQESRIIMNAHRINEGGMPEISNKPGSDFFFVPEEDPEKAAELIVQLVKERLPGYYRTGNIQVLTPMQRGAVGAANLNQMLQEALNPGGEGLRRGGTVFRTRDKIMQIRNNYDKEVFNGDIGVVTGIDTEERELTAEFDGRTVRYDISELDEVVLAYATTIHKAQGSEYPIVVMPVMMTHYIMLQRNLVYTGITRARKALVMIGSRKALAIAVRNVTVESRNTLLAERLKGSILQEQSGADAPEGADANGRL